jgi:hypothetical protein
MKTYSSRNIAFLSMVGVVTGTYLILKALKPGDDIVSEDERFSMHGHTDPNQQTDQGQLSTPPRPKPQIKKDY